jgi:AraC family transcriptional regulator
MLSSVMLAARDLVMDAHIDLSRRKHIPKAISCQRATFDFFAFECVHISGTEPYDTSWDGSANYVALHHIQRKDGEIVFGGELHSTEKDVRGKLTFLPKGCSAKGWHVPAVRWNSFVALYFQPGLLEGEELRFTGLAPKIYFQSETLRTSLQKMERIFRSDAINDSLYVETLALLTAIEALGYATSPNVVVESPAMSATQLARVIDFFNDNLMHQIPLTDAARIAGLSRFQFTRAFKQATGVPPSQYLTSLRVQRAQELLRDANLGIEDIARLVGFSGVTQFSRWFSKALSVSPSVYRKGL